MQIRILAFTLLKLLKATIFDKECEPLFSLEIYGNIIGMFELNNLQLSGKNLTGNIPSVLTRLSGLEELWVDGNSLTGPIPDFIGCVDLKIIHLENNQLAGELPSSLANLPNLKELYVQNNKLSGIVPWSLLNEDLVLT